MKKQLLTNGNVFKRTDDRWGGVIWYKDEQGGGLSVAFADKSHHFYIYAHDLVLIGWYSNAETLIDQGIIMYITFPLVTSTM